jgi:catechol 2,3-dioxygenase-like lactoylglutathione lyase family enzyme
MAPLSRLDHVIIAVKNLDQAANTYRKLGFTLTPRGLHEGRGTGNHCIMFKHSYIELLGIVDEVGAQGRLAERVNARGEGAMGIAYGADDAGKAVAALRAAGIATEEPNELSRPLDLDGKREMVRFTNVMLPNLTLPNVMQFVCTHLTPQLTRARHDWQLHPNGATGVAEISVAVDNPATYASEMNKLHGNALRNTRIKLAYRSELETRLGRALNGAPRDGIVAMTVTVNEPDATSAMLGMAKVPHEEMRGIVTVPASAAHGVVLQFAED